MSRRPPPPSEEPPFYILIVVNSSIVAVSMTAAGVAYVVTLSQEIAFVAFLAALALLTIFRGRFMKMFWPTGGDSRPPRRRR